MITQESTLTKPSSRRSRTKLRKPKFLRLHLISTVPPPPPPMPTTTTTTTNHHKQLINLFPLHPENNINKALIDEEDHNMAACIFSSCDDVDGAATTLTGILCSSGEQDHYNNNNNNNPSPSSSVNYADEEVDLVRTAMRRNNKTERNDHNDNDNDDDLKWVCYSEVVEENKKKIKIKKEVRVRGLSASSSSSSTSSYHHHYNHHHHHNHDHNGVDDDDDHGRKLVLKLDYEKIMNSWVNKGPLYIKNNKNPDIQTVPELQEDDFFLPSSTIGLTQCERENGGNEGSWTVPEMVGIENNDTDRGEDLMQAVGSNTMIHHREASVQRYKEKRRNRLFAKTIRYEVRKLNAEKRPRIKGRFVKRN